MDEQKAHKKAVKRAYKRARRRTVLLWKFLRSEERRGGKEC